MNESPYVIKKRSLGQLPFRNRQVLRLERLDIELTERCNNDCIHCCINLAAGDTSARDREMTTEQIKYILKEAADLGCIQVRFTGGEPLIRPDWQDLYLFARKLGLKVLLFTNARLITAQVADLLASTPPLDFVEVSVYGLRRESYEAVTRVPGSFKQFQNGINMLLQRKIPFVVKSVLLPQNKQEKEELARWAKEIPWMSKPPVFTTVLELRGRRDNVDRNALILELRPTPTDIIEHLTENPEMYKKEMREFAAKFLKPPSNTLFPCGAGRSICIDAYGYAQPCTSVRAPRMTIPLILPNRQKFSDQHTASTLLDARKPENLAGVLAKFATIDQLQGTNPEYQKRCGRCFLKGLCEQCPGKSWSEKGTLDTPVDYLCNIAHAQARYLGWLGQKEKSWEVVDWCERIGNSSPRQL